MMTMLINGRGEEGYALSDNEIRDSIISLITAGYETTSGAMAWAIYTLLTLPGAWDTAADEVTPRARRTTPGRGPTSTALTYLNGVVHETLRLYSPGVISARRVMRDLSFDGHRIRGRPIADLQRVRHPSAARAMARANRIPAAALGSRLSRTTASPHRTSSFRSAGACTAASARCMATTEMTVMLARLVARTTLRLPAQRIRAANLAALCPKPGLTVDVADSVPAQ